MAQTKRRGDEHDRDNKRQRLGHSGSQVRSDTQVRSIIPFVDGKSLTAPVPQTRRHVQTRNVTVQIQGHSSASSATSTRDTLSDFHGTAMAGYPDDQYETQSQRSASEETENLESEEVDSLDEAGVATTICDDEEEPGQNLEEYLDGRAQEHYFSEAAEGDHGYDGGEHQVPVSVQSSRDATPAAPPGPKPLPEDPSATHAGSRRRSSVRQFKREHQGFFLSAHGLFTTKFTESYIVEESL